MVVVVLAVDRHVGKPVGAPEILSRGFLHAEDSDPLRNEIKTLVSSVIDGFSEEERSDRAVMQQRIKAALKRHLQKRVDRRPVILPVVIQV
ncbi:MAG: hypothetical protein L0214_09685 [candidate division NC10 bacterium]|nr:hypothetical protein [candidate division NC10 bacterium]